MPRALPRKHKTAKRTSDSQRLVQVFTLSFCVRTFLLLATRIMLTQCLVSVSCDDQQACPAPEDFIQVGVIVGSERGERHMKVMAKAAAKAFKQLCTACLKMNFSYTLLIADCKEGDGLSSVIRNQVLPTKASNITRAFIGPSCDQLCKEAGLLAGYAGDAIISYGCHSVLLGDAKLYPTFVRTTSSVIELIRFINALRRNYDFMQSICVVSSAAEEADSLIWAEIIEEQKRNERHTEHTEFWSMDLNSRTFQTELSQHSNAFQVFLLVMSPMRTLEMLKKMKHLGYFRYGYVFISFNYMNLGKYLKEQQPNADFTGLLDITPAVEPHSKTFKDFVDAVVERDNSSCQDFGVPDYELAVHAALMNDAIFVLADNFLQHRNCFKSNRSGECFTNSLRNQSARGVGSFDKRGYMLTGNMRFSKDLTRYSRFLLSNLVNGCYVPIGYSEFIRSTPFIGFSQLYRKVVWPGGSFAAPECFSDACRSLRGSSSGVALVVVVGTTALLLSTIFLLIYYRWQTLKEIGRRDWIIPSHKLFAPAGTRHSTVAMTRFRLSRTKSEARKTAANESIRSMVKGQIFAKVTILDQQLVAVKQVNKHTLELTVDVIKEVVQVQRLKHGNVNRLVGACIIPDNISLVWDYCVKGSLRDILMNFSIRLDWMFKLSFINDIAKGMAYLHSSPVCVHGRLKSSNVVVDSNWNCKLTDIYMPCFRQDEQSITTSAYKEFYDLLWTAPELLRLTRRPNGTKKGDIYSFAIIMHEVIARTEPFELMHDEDPEDLVKRVMNEENPPFRPPIPPVGRADNFSNMSNEGVLDIMSMCWDEYPLFRPSFNVIVQNLKTIRAAFGSGGNLVDQMVEVVMKYADNLEDLVQERTEQLAHEQRRSDELINRMLPKSVVHDLKLGNMVIPEWYHSVTIFFSDIVGFTALSASSTPMQVVSLLNNLYTMFDNCVDKFDAYKIETIGDAYMVVSGLPVRNGDQHAGEIATAALHILTGVLSFKIPHCPDRQLYLRIGIHTGPVVAGVVGLKMPRYCLFGETVNYAAAMESSGLPLHIHVSPECKGYLDLLGGYRLEPRGGVQIKGKDTVLTYFLKSKDDFYQKTPELLPGVEKRVGIEVFR